MYRPIISTDFAVNSRSTETHHDLCLYNWMPSFLSIFHTVSSDPPSLSAIKGPFHTAWPSGGSVSMSFTIWILRSVGYFFGFLVLVSS